MIKAVFFDVDGTLVSFIDHKVPDSARKAIAELRKKGILCFLATGRHLLELEEMACYDIVFDGYVTTNGQICLDQDHNVIWRLPFKEKTRRAMAEIFNKKEVPLLFIEEGRMYHNIIDQRVIDAYGILATTIPEVGDYTGAPVYQACTYIKEGEVDYKAKFPEGLNFMWWHNNAIDILESEGKIVGIEHMCELYDLKKSEIMAFGDAENDRAMLEHVGTAIAMGNADEDIKKLADHVTASVEDDGIYKALVHYGLL